MELGSGNTEIETQVWRYETESKDRNEIELRFIGKLEKSSNEELWFLEICLVVLEK